MKKLDLHTDFQLQEHSFTDVNELLSFSKKNYPELYLFFFEWFNNKSFVEVKTSGSTGKPKAIKLKKAHMIASAIATSEYFELQAKTTALLCMSPNYIAGKMMMVRALCLGWHLDVVKPTNHPLKTTNKKYDFCAMVPTQAHHSLDYLHRVKKLIVGGGDVSEDLVGKFQKVSSAIYSTYGMTETITHIAVKKLNNFKNGIASEMKKSHYKTLPNISISTDERGCLIIDAPTISDKKIITNDLVEIISANEFYWLGRYDSIINSGGIKIIPEQIEEKISKLIQHRLFVVGFPDTILGEKLVLIIEGSKNEKVIETINSFDGLAKFEKPKKIYFLNKFIETETQKINKKETLNLLINNC
ncbi:AMP-binding protein [Lutibacter sp.]|uniref:AMP-binding protein n=1 Tax=Lutibacter sp. TaxID=1925666 RepID=UPI00273643A9|nr:AMP-binding protein [Lutibacter sp.]MDP3313992.1 AMP-binding protein [Lutibacter sp.]